MYIYIYVCVGVCVFLIVLDAPAYKKNFLIRHPSLQNPGSADGIRV